MQVPPTSGRRLEAAALVACIASMLCALALQAAPAGSAKTAPTLPLARDNPYVVPDLRGLSRVRAISTLQARGLRLGGVGSVKSGARAGTVVRQSPSPGTQVQYLSAVDVWVAAAPTEVIVPSVVARPDKVAVQIIRKAELRIGSIQHRPSTRPAGTVLSQKPAPRTSVGKGTRVDLVIARVSPVRVPSLLGESGSSARQILAKAGLSLGSVEQRESNKAAGTVLAQSPRAQEPVPPGSPVNITLAEPLQAAIPSLAERSKDEAARRRDKARLTVGKARWKESQRAEGAVSAQSPAARTRVSRRSPIDPTISIASSVSVPTVIGQSLEAAREALSERGLVLAVTDSTYTWTLQKEIVQRQRPLPESEVAPESVVTVAVMMSVWRSAGLVRTAGGTFGLAFFSLGVLKWFRARRRSESRRARPDAPRVRIRPCRDAGRQQLWPEPKGGPGHELRIRPCLDSGRQDFCVTEQGDTGE